MNEIAISVRSLSKKYRLYDTPQHRLKEALHPFRKKYHRDFWALKDVSFEVSKGETIGIIGRNGSGKSTLLQIITGTMTPSAGIVEVRGRVSALLELGAGFNPEFTGRQNVYMNGALIGYSKEEVDERFQAIADFADIGDFIDQPVKTYSSGMYVRLAFATAISVEPDILVVDEALSVGDMFFQAKCITRMKKMIDHGVTLLFVSHDTGSIKSLCRKAVLLDCGSLIAYDKSNRVVEQYFAHKVREKQKVIGTRVAEKDQLAAKGHRLPNAGPFSASFTDNDAFLKKAFFERIQNGKAQFINVKLLNEDLDEIQSVEYRQLVILRMCVEIREDLYLISCGYHIKDRNGVSIVNSNLSVEDRMLRFPVRGERYVIDWKFRVSLMEGIYNVACVLSVPLNLEFDEVDFCDYVPCAVQFHVQKMKDSRLYGYVHWDNYVDVINVKE